MSQPLARPGRPLAALSTLLALWIGARIVLWQSPFALDLPPVSQFAFDPAHLRAPVQALPPAAQGARAGAQAAASEPRSMNAPAARIPAPLALPLAPALPAVLPAASAASFYDPTALASRGAPLDDSTGEQLMWLAAYDSAEPARYAGPVARAAGGGIRAGRGKAETMPMALSPGHGEAGPGRAAPGRWSLSGWAHLRAGSAAAPATSGAIPVYGASQIGAVMRYRLVPGTRFDPRVYARASAALDRRSERELAAGLALRPLAGLPAAIMAEARWRDQPGLRAVRPAAMVVSEMDPVAIGARVLAESYVQAGYVGGRGATAFADGQLRLTADLAAFDLGRVRVGAGAWGGAQRGAARLDLGPTAQLDLASDKPPLRLSVDYRIRVAGDAQPGSGAALTLSTGF